MQSQSVSLKQLCALCDEMVQAVTAVHHPRDENSTPYIAKPWPYTKPSGILS